jgi:hypothetical protein
MNNLSEIFEVFHNREEFFNKIRERSNNRMIFQQVIVICFFTFIYGIIMGINHSFFQGIVSGIKLIVLFSATLIICFPSFYVIQFIIGSKMKIQQMMIIILSGFVLSTSVMIAMSPIAIFFLITGSNYYFLHLLHIAFFIFSGVFGIRLVIDALQSSCEKENIYPKIGVTIFKIWAVIFIFVGIQLAWNLRPFIGKRDSPFIMFNKHEGNFYAAVIYAIQHLSDNTNTGKTISTKVEKVFDSTQYKHTQELLNKINEQDKK